MTEVASVLDIPSSEGGEPFEVTHEDHLRRIQQLPAPQRLFSGPSTEEVPPLSIPKGVASRISDLVNRRRSNSGSTTSTKSSRTNYRPSKSDNSVSSAAAQSVEGLQSLAVASVETAIASNKTIKTTHHEEAKSGKTWTSKLKRMLAEKKAAIAERVHPIIQKSRSVEEGFYTPRTETSSPSKTGVSTPKRSRSYPNRPASPTQSDLANVLTDDSIRGRFDAVDMLSLGSAHHQQAEPTFSTLAECRKATSTLPSNSFTGASWILTPSRMVALSLGNGKVPPEMILEGFVPGMDDRWSVCIEQRHGRSLVEQPTEAQDGGSPNLPTQQLWNILWGSEPMPANTTDVEKVTSETSDQDPILSLAADCSVPIDIDEETFIVSTRDHLMAIYDMAATPLQRGDFGTALSVFHKLLKGLDVACSQFPFLKGTTYHNIGVIQLWQGDFDGALNSFSRAVEERQGHLPPLHPDTTVSMARKGLALFALDRLDEAKSIWQVALSSRNDLVHAKIRHNLAVLSYRRNDLSGALKQLIQALQIQRSFLDSPVRREGVVLDAALTLSNMGRVYLERCDYDLAAHVYEEALLLQTTVLRKDHSSVLSTLTNVALAHAQNGETQRSINILQGCLRSQQSRYGRQSVPAMETLGLLGILHDRIHQFPDAMRCLAVVKRWQKSHLRSPETSPSYKQTDELISRVEDRIGNDVTIWV